MIRGNALKKLERELRDFPEFHPALLRWNRREVVSAFSGYNDELRVWNMIGVALRVCRGRRDFVGVTHHNTDRHVDFAQTSLGEAGTNRRRQREEGLNARVLVRNFRAANRLTTCVLVLRIRDESLDRRDERRLGRRRVLSEQFQIEPRSAQPESRGSAQRKSCGSDARSIDFGESSESASNRVRTTETSRARSQQKKSVAVSMPVRSSSSSVPL